jgi:hypothetical protein
LGTSRRDRNAPMATNDAVIDSADLLPQRKWTDGLLILRSWRDLARRYSFGRFDILWKRAKKNQLHETPQLARDGKTRLHCIAAAHTPIGTARNSARVARNTSKGTAKHGCCPACERQSGVAKKVGHLRHARRHRKREQSSPRKHRRRRIP